MPARGWWRRRPLWQQLLIVAAPGVGIGALAGYALQRRQERKAIPPGPYTPLEELPDLLDFDSEESDEEPPPGIEYDEFDAPCVVLPEQPLPPGFEAAEAEEFCTPPKDLEPMKKTEVAFAEGDDRPSWPLDTEAKRKLQVSYQDVRGKWHGRWGRHFGASRKAKDGGSRHHAGIDLFADPGDVVVATEAGEVIAGLPFYKGTGALYVLTDSGLIVNYGELEKNSWRDFGIRGGLGSGESVEAGQEIARVGLSDDGSHMLHLEIYDEDVSVDSIRRGAMRWRKGKPAPEHLLDPTRYLVRAHHAKHEDMIEQV